MPKPPGHVLIWSPESSIYELHAPDLPPVQFVSGVEEPWFFWLTTHTSFSFQGQYGRLSVYKESRKRGAGYWYAYQTSSVQTRKRYLRRSETVTFARLEEAAQNLQTFNQEPSPESPHASASLASLQAAQATNEIFPSIGQTGLESGATMVMTRLSPPRLPATLVVRERLLSALDTTLSRPLTLLSASAGWGKTTLLSAWAYRHPQAVAWLSLEALDNDPTRFWVSLIAALRRCWPEIGERASALLQATGSLSPGLTILLNELADRSAETSLVLLILDDYHVIDEPTIHASLTFWIEHLPSHVHLVLASRVDPDLPLSRFRARGQMLEIRDTDLRFTREEAQHFLTQSMGLPLSERDIELLETRTEGWIASLQLAALFLRKQTDPSAGVQMLRGSQRFFLDYLREEILASLSKDVQVFLLQTSGLNLLSASLCNAITGRDDSERLLEQVERANLFLQPVDESGQWYRYHALWAQAMQHEARRRLGLATMRSLSSKASRWYEQQRLLPEAIEAALTCEEFSRAAMLIERFAAPNSFRNEYHLLCSWLKQLPEEIIQAQPELCSWYVLALMFTTDRHSSDSWARSEQLIQWAEQGFEAKQQWDKLGEALQLHAELAFYQEDLTRTLAFARQAQPLLSEHSFLYPDTILANGLEAFLAGDMDVAGRSFLEAHRKAKQIDSLVAMFCASLLLGEVCLQKGELNRASRYYQQALALFDEDQEIFRQQFLSTGGKDPFFTSWAYHSLAQLSYERNDLASAQRSLSQALALREKLEAGVHVLASGALIQARLLHTSGETAQAQDVLSKWEMHTRFPWSVRAIRACRARLHLIDGDLSMVELWMQEKQQAGQSQAPEQEEELPLMLQQEEALLLARLCIAQKRGETALKALVFWKEKAQAQGRKRSVLEIQILVSLAHFVPQEATQARSSLREALKLAQPENYQRLFLDEGRAMETLLKTLLPELREASLISFVRTLLRAFAQESPPLHAKDTPSAGKKPLHMEPLSSQEQRVLCLLVAGRSNPEIARELVISLNTVKTHVQSLYGKLNVHNRVEASEAARHLSLL
ncbi:LuxR family transcriptional regulator [Ktedonobacter sp. SOSP1-85]|uniref:LuxR C-terminal-related transcriptional regulator n=1 Tax=Ktedonobacter sp. SOSP1-85 TaxID=2778367 RepID=UPI0019155BFE|nr:LuxR C-terminal-related transcriptional regulator [Ktedonobacter sp. SOSP1-85]GHO81524.1 LuxR family transcriptional regulator [Ktedonobacter sp. SOSP1-85]